MSSIHTSASRAGGQKLSPVIKVAAWLTRKYPTVCERDDTQNAKTSYVDDYEHDLKAELLHKVPS
ncbi:hypothetical protein PR048_001350 [Dryococelus australis]|uniref:Uncharacterized protein n=1 Tax=Dryococelus australis TaxID=614101 RepID=A0ABQ9IH83_9NEOP|nr:hypothetical protein PR048_001350 [Dryococelus australis]